MVWFHGFTRLSTIEFWSPGRSAGHGGDVPPFLKRRRFDHAHEQGRKSPPLPIQSFHDLVDRLDIMVVEAAPQGVSEQLFGQAAVKIQAMPFFEDALQVADVVERLAREQPARRIDRLPASFSRHRPSALKFSSARPSGSMREWHELHSGLARCRAISSRTVGSFPLKSLLRLFKRRDVRRRGRRGRAQEVIQNELAPLHRRGSGRVGGHQQDRRHASARRRGGCPWGA